MPDAFLDRLGISQIKFQEDDSPQVSCELQMPLCHVVPVWYNNRASLSSQSIDDVAPEEAGRAGDGDAFAAEIHVGDTLRDRRGRPPASAALLPRVVQA